MRPLAQVLGIEPKVKKIRITREGWGWGAGKSRRATKGRGTVIKNIQSKQLKASYLQTNSTFLYLSDFRRSPSPSRRKHGITKAKSRSSARRKTKLDNYDADLSMEDSLNSLVPLHTDKNGMINIDRRDSAGDDWSGDDILSHLSSLRNVSLLFWKIFKLVLGLDNFRTICLRKWLETLMTV